MPRAKTYEPRCPAVNCSGGTFGRIGPFSEGDEKIIPEEIRKRIPEYGLVYRCGYCGLVWAQSGSSMAGFEPIPLGFYDSIHARGAWLTIENPRTTEIREEHTKLFWDLRKEKLKRRRQR